MPWCEHCRDHFAEDHYGGGYGEGHKVGAQYGPTGAFLAGRAAAERLRDGLAEAERNGAMMGWYGFVSVDDIEEVIRAFGMQE